MKTFISAILFTLLLFEMNVAAAAESPSNLDCLTYSLTQSQGNITLWTTPPSERVFKDDPLPEQTGSLVQVYCARNEFEPFQIVIRPDLSETVSIDITDFTNSIKTEIHRVKYVNITQPTDSLGRTGSYPDPLWPIEKGGAINLAANENTALWITVHVPETTPYGDYTANLRLNTSIGQLSIPLSLHVFNFTIPREIHTKSQMNFSHNTILSKYGVSGYSSDYWKYVDMIKQFFIEHRLTPKSVLWSGGITGTGAGPYIDYDCAGTFTDNEGIWGFEEPAARYLDGTGLMAGTFDDYFNGRTGFPSFMAATFQNNDASDDQRPQTFCEVNRTASDWYTADNPDSNYNKKWFSYITALEDYLKVKGYLTRAYYYIANEPQNQEDYDAVAWYSQELKQAAPNLKLMVSEEAKPEIFDHPLYTGAKIDIWLPVMNNYDPDLAHARAAFDEETWIYWLHGTRPPYFNPITLDHPGIESKFTGWFLWKYRIRGIAYYSLNNWEKNPWTDPLNDNHNGDLFMLYPPSETNDTIVYGSNNHRFVPSIRFELMRDSLEDYEYLYVLNNGEDPEINAENQADALAGKIITGTAAYTRNSEFLYNLRRLIGLKNGGEISEIPDIRPPSIHPRTQESPASYYINFQDPGESFETNPWGSPVMEDKTIDGISYSILDYDDRSYFAIGADAYDEEKGFGWFGNIINQPGERRDPWGNETDERKRTYVYDDYGRVNTFEFALPSGEYSVLLCVGTPRKKYGHNNVTIEGIPFVVDKENDYFIEITKTVTVSDSSLTMEIGLAGIDEYTMLNYLHIEAKATEPPALDINNPDFYYVLTDNSPDCTLLSQKAYHVYGTSMANQITVESGVVAKLINFPGSNIIIFKSPSNLFTVTRSGAYVTFEGSDGTLLHMPATTDPQTISFSDKDVTLVIDARGKSCLEIKQ